MGQTLTHGVYLPSEGERNCYNGLASNWRLLDGAIGTVAAHTTAIAGKASASHTHGNITNDGKVGTTANLPLITGTGGAVQAGSFGNSANTFCEGNDSRLSDARTPVAHTHTKSDVTDLLNSNFIPSANNSYDLGSSSYQWNNLYAQSYYYNGVAWGLDKANTWTGTQTILGSYLENESSGNARTCLCLMANRDTAAQSGIYVTKFRQNRAQGAMNPPDLHFLSFDVLENATRTNGALVLSVTGWNGNVPDSALLYSTYANSQLGTSTNKWATLNGINPGALSLPNINYTEGSPDVYNVGTDINNLTKNTTDPLHFSWTSPFDGWLAIMWYLNGIQPPYNVLVTTGDARYSKFSQTWSASSARWYLATTFPVVKNVTYYFEIDFQNTTIGVVHHAYLLPCLGNV